MISCSARRKIAARSPSTLPGKGHAEPSVKWRKADFSGYFSTGTVGPEETVLIVTNALAPLPRADLRCLDPATGDELWKKENLGYFHFAVMSVADGKLLISDDGGDPDCWPKPRVRAIGNWPSRKSASARSTVRRWPMVGCSFATTPK